MSDKNDDEVVIVTKANILSGEVETGKRVMFASVIIIFAIVLALVLEIALVELKFSKPDLRYNLEAYCAQSCTENDFLMAMEQDAQLLRTDRVRTSMISRLMIFVIAEVVALMLVALGGVLIFNRIENANLSNEASWKGFVLKSSFPGLIMCGLGATVICTTVYISGGTSLMLKVSDRPVYTYDDNFLRNNLNYFSGQYPADEDIQQQNSGDENKLVSPPVTTSEGD